MPIIILLVMLLVLIGIPAVIAFNVIDLATNGVTFWPVFWLALIFFGAWGAGSTGKDK